MFVVLFYSRLGHRIDGEESGDQVQMRSFTPRLKKKTELALCPAAAAAVGLWRERGRRRHSQDPEDRGGGGAPTKAATVGFLCQGRNYRPRGQGSCWGRETEGARRKCTA